MSADGLTFLLLNKKVSKEISLRGALCADSPLRIPLGRGPLWGPRLKGWQKEVSWGVSFQLQNRSIAFWHLIHSNLLFDIIKRCDFGR